MLVIFLIGDDAFADFLAGVQFLVSDLSPFISLRRRRAQVYLTHIGP